MPILAHNGYCDGCGHIDFIKKMHYFFINSKYGSTQSMEVLKVRKYSQHGFNDWLSVYQKPYHICATCVTIYFLPITQTRLVTSPIILLCVWFIKFQVVYRQEMNSMNIFTIITSTNLSINLSIYFLLIDISKGHKYEYDLTLTSL